jgi:hypothetical protein
MARTRDLIWREDVPTTYSIVRQKLTFQVTSLLHPLRPVCPVLYRKTGTTRDRTARMPAASTFDIRRDSRRCTILPEGVDMVVLSTSSHESSAMR